jgi:hypothetical protein
MKAQKLKQLQKLLDDIINENIDYTTQLHIEQKEVQLSEITKTIANLQRQNIPIPNEIIEVKLNLVNELDTLGDKQFINELVEILQQALSSIYLKESKSKHIHVSKTYYLKKKNIAVDKRILGLVKENQSLFPMDIFCHYKAEQYSAIINTDGTFSTVINGETFVLNSLNQLTVLVLGTQKNGWIFWKTRLNDKTIFLKYLIEGGAILS